MERSIQDVARLTGTTSRTLRHYDSVGLVAPSRIAANGYRYYDEHALVRLQRVLLLRQLGLGLPAIGEVLDGETDAVAALRGHLARLQDEADRIGRQQRSVERTIDAVERGEEIMAETMFDGFDHTQHRAEVEERWGADAYAAGDRWWRTKSPAERAEWQAALARLSADWRRAAARGIDPAGEEAQQLARRHAEWLAGVPATPRGDDLAGYLRGLGEMYVADERFGANYGGAAGGAFVRDALAAYADRL
ncbi:TipAS antibiotic-recognition domain-containing protein [Cnuibacter sp. UC19_7]|uniref:MerR family transcriptional regulator n=1 Tax=Cnuibacter sp. UC19_7 TaxID=3350166 RepID=UPI00366F612B